MTTPQPTWSDSGQGDLLELVAQGSATGAADDEWATYVEALRTVAIAHAGDIDPNALRKRVRGLVAPTDRWEISDDHEGRNAGRPCRVYRAQLALYRDST